mmetsp:Transcript_44133/g.49456  ORF Transcript_44133/g.49456 Transcript_44133/m.49456 type:complete len:333 (-) Transcript_44133:150-1148(-)
MLTMKSTAIILVLYTMYSTSVVQVSAQEEAHLRGGGARLTPRSFYSRLILEEKKIDTFTNTCSVGVTLSCPTTPEVLTLDNDCFDPFQVITFRYNSGDCHQSENLQNRHDFTCTDVNSSSGEGPTLPPPAAGSNSSYIVVTSNSGNETYFTGSVAVGEEYTVHANVGYDTQLSANLTITIFETKGGNSIQTTEVRRLDCTNPVFLFDKFGASQVTAWKEISGRVVTTPDDTIRVGNIALTVENPGTAPIQLVEMTLLSNSEDTPITDYTSEVQDTILQPTDELSLTNYQFEYDLATVPTRYIFFTTIIAEQLADGDTTNRQCNSFHTIECLL